MKFAALAAVVVVAFSGLVLAGEPPTKDAILNRFADEFVTLTPGEGKFPASFKMGSTADASEQPVRWSGISTVLVGFSNLVVSAMKWTPASTMVSASAFMASRASARLSPTISATQWKISGVM